MLERAEQDLLAAHKSLAELPGPVQKHITIGECRGQMGPSNRMKSASCNTGRWQSFEDKAASMQLHTARLHGLHSPTDRVSWTEMAAWLDALLSSLCSLSRCAPSKSLGRCPGGWQLP